MKKSRKYAKTIFIAMSGGVDSSVSAALLKEQGYNLVGVYMKNWSGDNYGIQDECPWEEEQKIVESVCQILNIPFRSFNFEKEYRQKVVEYFFREYEAGRTPNPDVMCNKEIKFGLFLEKSQKEGADLIATGHYARVKKGNDKRFHLYKGVDKNKDQSYFLHKITEEQLSKTLFPIGHLEKPEVRKIAEKYKLPNAKRKDSQGICFIGNIDVKKFLRSRLKEKSGKILDINTGDVVGDHDGVIFYTVGQREGLKIGGVEEPYFVVNKDLKRNILFVAMGRNNPALFKKEMPICDINWINMPSSRKVDVSVRYRQTPQKAVIDISGSNARITFYKPQRAITEGQSAAIYNKEECLGGGVIYSNSK
ncbi:tRNA 2-thiouridine(34) synthase MnmA [Candidatus Dojkabacteria bacterium]|nr:tRNA 2-thiouridine(34) synthase MnmA [Candidatus Dojkabacteria bacterium]